MTAVVVHPTHSRSELRHAILAVSERIGSEQGQAALTMRNIAAAIGVSPTVLYQHFDNKAAILRQLERLALAELTSRLDAAAAVALDPEARLYGLCTTYLAFARDKPWLYSLLFGASPAGAFHGADAFASRAARCLVAAGNLRADLAAAAAGWHAWAAMHGLALALRSGAFGHVDRGTSIQGYFRTLLIGLTQ